MIETPGNESDELKKTAVSDRDRTRAMPSIDPGVVKSLSEEEMEKIMKEVGKKRELPDDRLPSEVVAGDDDTTVFLPAIDPNSIRGLDENQDADDESATVVFQAVDPNVFKKKLTQEELDRIVEEVGKTDPKALDDRLPSEVSDDDEKDKKKKS